jgi:hypothetical protein
MDFRGRVDTIMSALTTLLEIRVLSLPLRRRALLPLH